MISDEKVSIIAIIAGVCVFIGALFGCGILINLIVSGFTDPNWRTGVKIVLWVIGFPLIFWVSILLGALVAGLVDNKNI